MTKEAYFPASRELFHLVRALNERRYPEENSGDIEVGRIVGFESARTSRWKHGRIAVNDAPKLLALAHHLDADYTLLSHVAAGYLSAEEGLAILDSETELTHFLSEQILLPENDRILSIKSGSGVQMRVHRRGPGRYERSAQRSAANIEAGDRQRVVLLVDDDPAAITVFGNLTGAGTGIDGRVARLGSEGLVMAGQLRPDLVIFDVFIGDVDGFRALRTLAGREETRAGLTVATSLSMTTDVVRRCYGAGADDVEPRPLEAQALERLIERLRRRQIS